MGACRRGVGSGEVSRTGFSLLGFRLSGYGSQYWQKIHRLKSKTPALTGPVLLKFVTPQRTFFSSQPIKNFAISELFFSDII